jgi:hypothetical protein
MRESKVIISVIMTKSITGHRRKEKSSSVKVSINRFSFLIHKKILVHGLQQLEKKRNALTIARLLLIFRITHDVK